MQISGSSQGKMCLSVRKVILLVLAVALLGWLITPMIQLYRAKVHFPSYAQRTLSPWIVAVFEYRARFGNWPNTLDEIPKPLRPIDGPAEGEYFTVFHTSTSWWYEVGTDRSPKFCIQNGWRQEVQYVFPPSTALEETVADQREFYGWRYFIGRSSRPMQSPGRSPD